MIWFSILTFCVFSVVFFLSRVAKREYRDFKTKYDTANQQQQQSKSYTDRGLGGLAEKVDEALSSFRMFTLASRGLFVLALVLLIISCITFVDAGTVGVQDMLGNVRDRVLSPGPAIKNPFAKIVEISTRTETYTMSAQHGEGAKQEDDSIPVLTKDGLQPPVDVTVAYHVVSADAPWLYKTFGLKYVDDIIRPSVRTAIRSGAAEFKWEEIFSTQRNAYAMKIETNLASSVKDLISNRKYDGMVVAVDQVMVRDIQPPKKVKDAIEEKLAEQQKAEKMEFTLLREKKEAERKRIEATGIRDFQAIVVQGVTPSLLTWKWLEVQMEMAKSPNKVFIIADGNAPPIMMPAN